MKNNRELTIDVISNSGCIMVLVRPLKSSWIIREAVLHS